MYLDFTSAEQLPFSEVAAHNRKNSDELVRSGLVDLSRIAIGTVILLPFLGEFASHLKMNKSSIYRYGGYPEIVQRITGLTIVETTGVVAVANAANIVPLSKYFKTDGNPRSRAIAWKINSGNKLRDGAAKQPYYLNEERLLGGIVDTSRILLGGEVALVPSVHALEDALDVSFAGTYSKGFGFHKVIETVTGLDVVVARHIALPSGTYLEHASNVMNSDGTRNQASQTQQNLALMS
ncbi:MAG TPA: hypothetical protein VLG47_07680 [Candidatus Saccharimonadales bacterium]|nr:hypothetical protein [Candidatus Saccharimonadales bacterium]